jgi:hypothetical protein
MKSEKPKTYQHSYKNNLVSVAMDAADLHHHVVFYLFLCKAFFYENTILQMSLYYCFHHGELALHMKHFTINPSNQSRISVKFLPYCFLIYSDRTKNCGA